MNIFNNFSIIFESNKLIQAEFGKGRGTRDQIANIPWIMEKARELQKNIYFCFIDYAMPLTVWITVNWKILKEMGIPDQHLPPEKSVCRSESNSQNWTWTTDWFQTGKGVR